MKQLKHDWRNAFCWQACLLLALLSVSGCGLTRETQRVAELTRRTTFLEPRFFDYVHNDKLAQREARLVAEQAWAEVVDSVPNPSPDYEYGFVEGFADYLYRGGAGEAPLIPPRGYWNLRFLNPRGKATMNDFFEGFRHGAQTCKNSGLRNNWVVPTSLLLGEGHDASGGKNLNQPYEMAPPIIEKKPVVPAVPTEQPPTDDGRGRSRRRGSRC